jgi:hypothetical protein
MKVISIAIVRTGSDLNEPIPLSVTNDLSSFGFFQRQVRSIELAEVGDSGCACCC